MKSQMRKNRQVLQALHHLNPMDYLKESSYTLLKLHTRQKWVRIYEMVGLKLYFQYILCCIAQIICILEIIFYSKIKNFNFDE